MLAAIGLGCGRQATQPAVAADKPQLAILRSVGTSMLPAIKDGETIVAIMGYPFSRLKAGNVVIYRSKLFNETIEHRLVDNRGGGWVVKGDNNPNYDPEWVTLENYKGMVMLTQDEWNAAIPVLPHDIMADDNGR
jgi:signal peptidase I